MIFKQKKLNKTDDQIRWLKVENDTLFWDGGSQFDQIYR
jgi:hypothetical protein